MSLRIGSVVVVTVVVMVAVVVAVVVSSIRVSSERDDTILFHTPVLSWRENVCGRKEGKGSGHISACLFPSKRTNIEKVEILALKTGLIVFYTM